MRALVTGGNGFVGRYLVAELRRSAVETVASGRPADGAGVDVPLDLASGDSVRTVVADARADVVFHLAAQASVPVATREPLETYDTNVLGTARLVEAIRDVEAARRPRLIFVSSSEVYGGGPETTLPFRESDVPRPATPYAASKVAGEAIALASARTYGLRVVIARAFNHIGPGQSDRFAVAAFAKRLAAVAAGGSPVFPVGNLTARRDFLDVRDVVRAYVALATLGIDGETYNVCSGTPTLVSDVLRSLVLYAGVPVEIREDPALVRPVDVPLSFGDDAKLRATTGWRPDRPLGQALRDVYDDARAAAGVA